MNRKYLFSILFVILITFYGTAFSQDDTEKFFIDQINANPNVADNYYNLGTYYYTINNNKKAIQHLRKATEIKPNYFNALITLGNAYEQSKQNDSAIEAFKQALKIKPDNKELLNKIEALQKPIPTQSEPAVSNPTTSPNTPVNNTSTNSKTNFEDYFNEKYLFNLFLIFTIILIIIVLWPAFLLWFSSILVKIETNTFFKSFIAVIASDFIYLFILAISNNSSTGGIVAFIFSIIVIQAVYETTFNKALLTWVFSSLLFIASMYLLMISTTSLFFYSNIPYKIAKFIKDKNQWNVNEIKSFNKPNYSINNNKSNNNNLKCIENMKIIKSALALYSKSNKVSNKLITTSQLSDMGFLQTEPKCEKSNYIILINNRQADIYCPKHHIYLSNIK